MSKTRAGFVALIGAPNAGKSTLLNRLVGVKIAGVTHKVQTTRTRLRGIVSVQNTQIIFIDTPGLFHPKKHLEKAMVTDAWAGVDEADITVFMVDAQKGLSDGVLRILDRLEPYKEKTRLVLALNKIDRVKAPSLLELVKKLSERIVFESHFMISAQRGHGVDDLQNWLAGALPLGPWLYPEEQIADQSLHTIAAEITREKLMLRLHQELPYQLMVKPETWARQRDGSVRIEQIIHVARAGHKGIVLGKGGTTVKAVSQAARSDVAELVGAPVHLFLRVKVSPEWWDNPANLGVLD